MRSVWDTVVYDFESSAIEQYPLTAPPLLAGVQYQWRVKVLLPYGGSSSTWMAFTVVP